MGVGRRESGCHSQHEASLFNIVKLKLPPAFRGSERLVGIQTCS